jgi:hypothetical protein
MHRKCYQFALYVHTNNYLLKYSTYTFFIFNTKKDALTWMLWFGSTGIKLDQQGILKNTKKKKKLLKILKYVSS